MSAEEYLSAQDLRGVLLNALRHVQRACAGDVDTVRHVEAAAEYFHSVATTRHVVGCAFQEVTASPRNRAAFHVNVSRVLETMANERAAPAEDWHEILVRLCPDFPFGVTRLAVRAACADEGGPLENASENASASALAPALRVAVEQWRFLEKALADAFGGEPEAPRDAERCLETIFFFIIFVLLVALRRTRRRERPGSGKRERARRDDRRSNRFRSVRARGDGGGGDDRKRNRRGGGDGDARRVRRRDVSAPAASSRGVARVRGGGEARGGGGCGGGARLQVDD